jgi:hypothetical protein
MAFPVDEQYIIETEKELELKFPPTFKGKMKIENGGEIETADDSWTIHPFFDKSDIKRIKRTTNNIILETNNSRKWGNFPPTAIAIGDTGSGDKLILLPSANNPTQLSDKIYFWSHETGEVTAIADDINELIE